MTAALCALVVVTLAHRLRPHADRTALRGAHDSAADRESGSDSGRRPGGWARSPARAIRERRERRSALAPAVIADWCGDLARSIRSGAALRVALEQTVPADPGLRRAITPIRFGLTRGSTIPQAVEAGVLITGHRSRRGTEHFALACAVIDVCARCGGSAAAPLDRVAAALRQRAADDQERAAHAAQARLSAHVLTVIPIAVLSLLGGVDDGVRSALKTPIGATCVLLGAVLNLGGWLWMRRIIRGVA